MQKLAYFLQNAGEDLNLNFVKHNYGPYSDQLRHALNAMEGHFIIGLGDGVVESEIEPVAEALADADTFIAKAGLDDTLRRTQRVAELIDGFQSSYGMELLATVHWVAKNEASINSKDMATEAIHLWSNRKKHLMSRQHVCIAWDRLSDLGWL